MNRLTDLEGLLRCPLEVVSKAFMNGSCGSIVIFVQNDYNEVYKKGFYKEVVIDSLARKCNSNDFYFQCTDTLTYKSYIIYLKDYKITWWLKKDKTE